MNHEPHSQELRMDNLMDDYQEKEKNTIIVNPDYEKYHKIDPTCPATFDSKKEAENYRRWLKFWGFVR